MSLVAGLLHITNFRTPFLQNLVPALAASYAVQTLFGVPGVLSANEHFYDFSGGITFLAATGLSLLLPVLRAGHALEPSAILAARDWRQLVLSGAVLAYSTRLSSYLFLRVLKKGGDSRFDTTKHKPGRFFFFWMAQATWVSVCLLPVILLNSAAAPAFAQLPAVTPSDVVGLGLFAAGWSYECLADYQKAAWLAEKQSKVHDEQFITRGLFAKSRYPNYLGDITLWTGIATAAAGVLITNPIQNAIGFGSGIVGKLGAALLSYVCPAFVAFLLLRVSGVPLSESKYDKLYGDREDYKKWRYNTPLLFPKLF
ncbi:hypothetical protein GQ53DRAFT_268861 [Thozetella sp. PMI_491]|nr:hypothetical protein GQ53DRAFT_268861 [Thozetella sp. PMI_491]